MMKNIKLPTKPETLNIVATVIGFIMILVSALFAVEKENYYSKVLNIIGDLGVGIFPTGIIGFLLEEMQNRNNEKQKNNKRSSILRLFNNAVHSYLNIVCNKAVVRNGNLKGKKVFDIIKTIKSGSLEIEYTEEEKVALTLLLERLSTAFESTNPLYIVTEVFDIIEINYFEMLLREGRLLLQSMNKDRLMPNTRNGFLEKLEILISEISGCESINEMISDGDNIYIP